MNNKKIKRLLLRTMSGSVLLLSLGFLGCNTKSTPKEEMAGVTWPITIDMTAVKNIDTPIKLSQIATNIKYISLSEEPLIDDIAYSPIRIFDDTLYLDGDNIFKYTPDGKFIKKLFPEGPGPTEAKKLRTEPAAFNSKDRYFTFKNAIGDTYKTYSFNGDYLGERIAYDTANINIKTYFIDNQIYEQHWYGSLKRGEKFNIIGPYIFYAKNLYTDSISYRYANPLPETDAIYRGVRMELDVEMRYFHIDSLLWFKYLAIDTLYATSDLKTIKPMYIFKTDDSFMDMNCYAHLKLGDLKEKEFNSKKKFGGVLPLFNKDLLYIVDEELGLADSLGQTAGYTKEPVQNDLDKYLKNIDLATIIHYGTFSIYKGYMYFLVNASSFFEDGSSSPFPNLTEDSNPVVVKLKLK
ncbi:MAG: hypothetical protein JXR54_12050 [Tannerellaceae bacterium]|nr:hypothetical protein [Tannerellaceae bacterium]